MRSMSICVWTGRLTGVVAGMLYGLILFFPLSYQGARELVWAILGLASAGAALALFAIVTVLRRRLVDVLLPVIGNALITTAITVVLLDLSRLRGLSVLAGVIIGFLVGTAIGAAFCRLCSDPDRASAGATR